MVLVGAAADSRRVSSGVLWRRMNAEHVHFSDWLLNLERGEG
jgi:hypothetical protein